MDEDFKKLLVKIAGAIRQLSIEAVQKANSGHPGLPLGCADIAAYLYGVLLNHNPAHAKWINRDRFVLSAGHGSMLLYSCLHLAGFGLSLDEIKNFRQLHSKTPGHPEYGETVGVEATTGPLGQGVGNAIGMALALKHSAQEFNKPDMKLFDAKVYCLAGDGCLMEGVSQEACSFAGHLCLDNFVLIFDSNKVTLDGPLSDSGSDDIAMRFKSYGFDVYEMDGHDLDSIHKTFTEVVRDQKKPVLIIAHTIIGKGAPHKEGTCKAHGAPLGEEELALTKKAWGLPDEPFFVPGAVRTFFEGKLKKDQEKENKWNALFARYKGAYPELYNKLAAMQEQKVPQGFEKLLREIPMKEPIALRAASHDIIGKIVDTLPYLIGGSADLSESDKTLIKQSSIIEKGNFGGRNIKFGIREFGMSTIANGLFLSQLYVPFIGTFLTFSDYMRNAIRLACLGHYHVIYQFTHDSIFLGEDGPTHQPVEHLMALRAIPNIHVIRPCDANEVKAAWLAALSYKGGPTALILTRQNLPILKETDMPYENTVLKGGYILKKETLPLQFTLIATGSEVSLAYSVAQQLEKLGKGTRVVSMPCFEIFRKQPKAYQAQVLAPNQGKKVSIEAGVTHGWAEWIGTEGISIGVDTFGASAPMSALAKEFGFTVESIIERILS